MAQWRRLLGSQKWQRPGGGAGGGGTVSPFAGGRSIDDGGGGGAGVGREIERAGGATAGRPKEVVEWMCGPVSPVVSKVFSPLFLLVSGRPDVDQQLNCRLRRIFLCHISPAASMSINTCRLRTNCYAISLD